MDSLSVLVSIPKNYERCLFTPAVERASERENVRRKRWSSFELFFVATELAPHKGKCGDRSLCEHNIFDQRNTSFSSVLLSPTLISHSTFHPLRQYGHGALRTSPDLRLHSNHHNSNTTPRQVGLGIAAAAFFGRAGLVALRRYQGGTNALGRAFYKGGFDAKINRREAALILQCR